MNNIIVCAENSFEMQESNQKISVWIKTKIKSLEGECTELSDAIVCAGKVMASTSVMKRRIKSVQRMIRYYQKIDKAIQHGYSLIPNVFWGNAIAIRTDKNTPTKSFSHQEKQSTRNSFCKILSPLSQ